MFAGRTRWWPAIRAERGDPRFVVKTGTADITIVGPAWPSTPMAVYGP